MPICGIVGCSNRPGVQKHLSFFKTPKIIKDQGEETRKLSEERRRLWKAAVGRTDIKTEEKWERTIVCSRHFVGGVKAYLHDRTNPSWLPSLHLGKREISLPVPDVHATIERYNRASQRRHKRAISDAASSLLSLKKRQIDFSKSVIEEHSTASESSACDNSTQCDDKSSESVLQSTLEDESNCKGIQTDLTIKELQQLEDDNKLLLIEASEKGKFDMKGLYNFTFYEKDTEKVEFYTGMPKFEVLKLVFNLIEGHLNSSLNCLSRENEFLLCMLKLKMNYLFKDIAYQLDVSEATVQRSFHNTLDVLHTRLKFLVKWPTRENLRKTMPMCFRKEFGEKIVVALDGFELFTEGSSSAQNKVYMYSNYKHNQTIKYLIGIAPQGVVIFISEGFGGRTADKYISEKSGLLYNLLPGDVVMVNRGFNVLEDAVNFLQAELAIPNVTPEKSKLRLLEVVDTREVASVQIHVERVINLVLRKFRILEGIVPIEFIELRSGENIPTIDKIVKVACCLTNLCPSVVPFD